MNTRDNPVPTPRKRLLATGNYLKTVPWLSVFLLGLSSLLVYRQWTSPGSPPECGAFGNEKSWIEACTGKLADRYLSQAERVEALIHRGEARTLANDTKGALADFDEAALLDPNYVGATTNWSSTFRMVEPRWPRCWDRAVKMDLIEACSIFIDNAGDGSKVARREALKARASAQNSVASNDGRSAQDGHKAEIADLDAALKISPNDADALEYRARASERIGALDDAIRDYTYAIVFTPLPLRNSPLRARAMVYRMQGKLDDARADYEAALKIDPRDMTAEAELHGILARAAPK